MKHGQEYDYDIRVHILQELIYLSSVYDVKKLETVIDKGEWIIKTKRDHYTFFK